MSRKLPLLFITAVTLGLAVGLVPTLIRQAAQQTPSGQPVVYAPYPSVPMGVYMTESNESMIDKADAILVGRVTAISPSSWNQDSGEPWQHEEGANNPSPLILHTIELEVIEPIIDDIGLGSTITITVLSSSPVDPSPSEVAHDLQVGDETVIFVRQTDIAWRDGTRPATLLVGYPRDAHYIKGNDGLYHRKKDSKPVPLGQLIAEIAKRRATLVEP
jgi:hypothetical protein